MQLTPLPLRHDPSLSQERQLSSLFFNTPSDIRLCALSLPLHISKYLATKQIIDDNPGPPALYPPLSTIPRLTHDILCNIVHNLPL